MPNGTFDDDRDEVAERRRRKQIEQDLEQFAGLVPGVSLDPIAIDDLAAALTVARQDGEGAVIRDADVNYSKVIDDMDAPSSIDSDAPASVYGGNLVSTREQARELFGRGTSLGGHTPLPFRIVERGNP